MSDFDSTDSGGILGANASTAPTASSLEAGPTIPKGHDDDDDNGGSGGGNGNTLNTDTNNNAQSRAGSENSSSNNDTNNNALLRAGREVKNGRSKLPVVPTRSRAAAQVGATAAVRPEVPTIVTRSGGNRRSSSFPTVVSTENTPVLLPPPSGSGDGKDGEQDLPPLPPKPRMSQVKITALKKTSVFRRLTAVVLILSVRPGKLFSFFAVGIVGPKAGYIF